MTEAVRRAAWRSDTTDGWHEDLVWYAAAVHQMRLRTPGLDEFFDTLIEAFQQGALAPTLVGRMSEIASTWSDPLGLGYHSQVHGTFVPVSQWPSVDGRPALWLECAHNHWFFLPWHRAFLLEYEAVARQHIADLEGPADTWGLPYWNYSDFDQDLGWLGLPLPTRGPRLPDGVVVPGVEAELDGSFANPLFIPVRAMQGDPDNADTDWADATDALLRPHFANQQDTGAVSLGGGVLEEAGNQALFHDQAQEIGQLDMQPHGSVHVQVNGAMALFQTAGLDPLFWMHHCNVDRLWETYAQDLGNSYPFANGVGVGSAAHQSWVTRKFRFLRPGGGTSEWTAPELLDVTSLGYVYDTTAPPPLPPAPEPPKGSELQPFGLDDAVPEPVASSDDVRLSGRSVEVRLRSGDGSGDDVPVAAFPAEARWVLRFDGIRSESPAATSFMVFLGLPDDQDSDRADVAHYGGLLSLFGVYEASQDDGTSPGDGARRQLDVTAQVHAQADTLRPMDVAVRLVPVERGSEVSPVPVSVSRLTLEFA